METGEQPANPLFDQHDALVEDVRRAIPLEVDRYGKLSADAQNAIAGRLVSLYLASLGEDRTESPRPVGVESFASRYSQGIPLAEVLRALGVVRRILCRAARALEPDELAEDVIARFESVSAVLIDAAVAGHERDLAEAASALAKLEARYREIYQRTPAMMHSLDAERRITAVSDRWLDTLEYTADEVLGRPSFDFFTEESRRRAVEMEATGIPVGDGLFNLPWQLAKKSGEIIDVRSSSVLERDERGDITLLLTVFDNVTAELEATHALRESEERWRALMELSPFPLCVHRDGVLLWMNEATMRLLGVTSAEQVIGKNVMEFVHPDDRAMVKARVREGQAHDESLPPMEQRYVSLDGRVIHAEVAARSVMFQGQRATQIASVDVTARKQAEDARRLSKAQARIIEVQVETLRALSTPLIPLDEGILVLPLIGRVTDDRADQILEVLAEGVQAQRASVAILDVTGVPEADASFAEALVRIAKSIRLLGAEVVITGVTPPIARALVALGTDLGRLTTCGTLRDGITHARRARRPVQRR
ncbi:MAG: PAS domain S-box protein [Byssovorax sp.]